MIQFEEHAFQRGWFNHQIDTSSTLGSTTVILLIPKFWVKQLDNQLEILQLDETL